MRKDEDELGPEELVVKYFSRCSNYPKERIGVIGLAQALRRIATEKVVDMDALCSRCALASPFCPTDAELFAAGSEMKALRMELQQDRERQAEDVRRVQENRGAPHPTPLRGQAQLNDATARYDEMWRRIKAHVKPPVSPSGHVRWPDWIALAKVAEALGYHDYAYCWRRSGPDGNGWSSGSGRITDEVLDRCVGPGVLQR